MAKTTTTKPWIYPFKVDADVEASIKKELSESTTGGEYGIIMNNRLRASYAKEAKAKKRVKK